MPLQRQSLFQDRLLGVRSSDGGHRRHMLPVDPRSNDQIRFRRGRDRIAHRGSTKRSGQNNEFDDILHQHRKEMVEDLNAKLEQNQKATDEQMQCISTEFVNNCNVLRTAEEHIVDKLARVRLHVEQPGRVSREVVLGDEIESFKDLYYSKCDQLKTLWAEYEAVQAKIQIAVNAISDTGSRGNDQPTPAPTGAKTMSLIEQACHEADDGLTAKLQDLANITKSAILENEDILKSYSTTSRAAMKKLAELMEHLE